MLPTLDSTLFINYCCKLYCLFFFNNHPLTYRRILSLFFQDHFNPELRTLGPCTHIGVPTYPLAPFQKILDAQSKLSETFFFYPNHELYFANLSLFDLNYDRPTVKLVYVKRLRLHPRYLHLVYPLAPYLLILFEYS